MFTYENQGTNTYLVYELASEEELDTLSLGMISNNNIPGIAPELFTQMNASKFVKYNISAKITLEELFESVITKKRLLDIFTNICATVLEAEEYMLDAAVFMWDVQRIYVDISTNETCLLCKPVVLQGNEQPDLRTFFKEMIFGITLDSNEDNSYFTSILNYLNGKGIFSVNDFKKLLQDLQKEAVVVKKMPQKESPATQTTSRSDAAEQISETVRKEPVLKIGNESTAANVTPGMVSEHMDAPQPVREKVSLAKVVALKEHQKEQKNNGGGELSATEEPAAAGKSRRLFAKKNSDKSNNKLRGKTKAEGGLFSSHKKQQDPVSGNTFAFDIPGQSGSQIINTKASPATVYSAPGDGQESENLQSVDVVPGYTQSQSDSADIRNKASEMLNAVSRPANFGNTTVLGGQQTRQSHPTVVLSELNHDEQQQRMPYLLRVKNNEKIEINREKIKIGKEAGFVDYVISDNSTVSRFHAAVIKRNSDVYIVDMNSSNHTYINGQMLTSNQEILLQDQDHIRFSNEEFIYMI